MTELKKCILNWQTIKDNKDSLKELSYNRKREELKRAELDKKQEDRKQKEEFQGNNRCRKA